MVLSSPENTGRPASSRRNTISSQNVQNVIMNTSKRDGGESGVSSTRNCVTKNQNTKTYGKALRIVTMILLVAVLATPFTVLFDGLWAAKVVAAALVFDIPLPAAQMMPAAIKLVIVGITHWVVTSFMGSPVVDGEVGANHRTATGEPAPLVAHGPGPEAQAEKGVA